MEKNNLLRDNFIKGALSGFFIFPLLMSHQFTPASTTNSVKMSWGRVNGYLSNGVRKVSAEYGKAKKSS